MANYRITTATKKIAKLDKRIRAVQGGTAASKTVSTLMYLIDDAQTDKAATLASVVSESFPHIRRGAMRDFLNVMEGQGYFNEGRWDKTNSTYCFESGSKIEFFSADQPDKVRGPRRDRLFINEANNVPLETFNQLEVRTNEYVFLDWNPTNEFWFYTDVIGHRDDVDHLILTYKDNEALNPEIIKSIEQRKVNKPWWKVYGLGQLGAVEGRIYTDWRIIDEVPHEARLIGYGLDFGFTNDPTVISSIHYHDGGYVVEEKLYGSGFNNQQIAEFLMTLPQAVVVADAAEPKSIEEIRIAGRGKIAVIPSTKGKGSVNARISFVQAQRMSITKDSTSIIRDYRNYMWSIDDSGRSINEPEHEFSHGMDSVGYGLNPRMAARDNDDKAKAAREYRQQEWPMPGRGHYATSSQPFDQADVPGQVGKFPRRGNL